MTTPSNDGAPDAMSCQDLVELVSDYIEGALPADERIRCEEHLAECDACTEYLSQIHETILATGRLREEAVPPGVRDQLLAHLVDWNLAT